VYPTHAWLTDEHKDQMLNLLQQELMKKGVSSNADIENTQFPPKLLEAYGSHKSYATALLFRWLHATGEIFASQKCRKLGMITNVNQNHWVAVVLDFKNQEILYGDSFRHKPDENLMAALRWWTHYHSRHAFKTINLPISYQLDGYSCGLLV
jgi:hypothetical protein